MSAQPGASFPDGIDGRHNEPSNARNIIWYRVAAIGVLLLVAVTGLLGGGKTPRITGRSSNLSFELHIPNPVRNGMFVEWRIDAVAHAPINDLVISIPANLWQDMTINSLVPAADKERSTNGEFVYHFGPLQPGERFRFKIDGQLNPARVKGQRGTIKLLDGRRVLVAKDVHMDVYP